MKSCIQILPLVALLSLALLVGCEKDNGTGPQNPTTAQGWIDLAWSNYEAGNLPGMGSADSAAYMVTRGDSLTAYQDSVYGVNNNDSALVVDASARLVLAREHLVEIFDIGGWFYLTLGAPGTANVNYNAALAINPQYDDVLGGNCFALQALSNWEQSTEMATATLVQDAAWEFTHNHQLSHLDLRLARAENYFNLGDFETSLEYALDLNNNYGLPTTPRQASEFNLATIEGRAALAQLINTLDDLI